MGGAREPGPLCRERTGDNWVDSGTSCKTQSQHPGPTGTKLRAKALGAPNALAILQVSLPLVLPLLSAAQIKKMQRVLDAGVLDPEIQKEAQKFYSRAYTRVGSLTFKDEALIHRGDKVMDDYISIKPDDYRIRLDYTALLTPDALVPVTDNPDEARYLARVRKTLDQVGVWLRFDERRVRSAEDPSQWVDDPHSYEAWLSLGAYGGVIPTTTGLLSREALMNNNRVGCGYYESVYRGWVQRGLEKEIRDLETDISSGLEQHQALGAIRRTAFPGVTEISDAKGGAKFPDESIWEPPRKLVLEALKLNVGGNVQKSLDYVHAAGQLTKLASRRITNYIDATSKGAKWAATWANRVRITSEIAEDVLGGVAVIRWVWVGGVRLAAARGAAARAAKGVEAIDDTWVHYQGREIIADYPRAAFDETWLDVEGKGVPRPTMPDKNAASKASRDFWIRYNKEEFERVKQAEETLWPDPEVYARVSPEEHFAVVKRIWDEMEMKYFGKLLIPR